MDSRVIRVAAVADIHCRTDSAGKLVPLFTEMAQQADVLCLCGDLTDHGTPEEATVLANELAAAGRVPIVSVLGNHDYEAGAVNELRRILAAANCVTLAGEVFETHGVGFAGTKGFGGGFGELALEPWGEDALKQYVHEAVAEALLLESALARVRDIPRVALLHYSPIRDTVANEPPEIFPFLGSSRLEEPLNRYHVSAVFHGHAHHGQANGRTSSGIPVYNVSLPLLRRRGEEASGFIVVEIETSAAAETNEVAARKRAS